MPKLTEVSWRWPSVRRLTHYPGNLLGNCGNAEPQRRETTLGKEQSAEQKRGIAHLHASGLLGLAPSQAPQSAHREYDGEERGHGEREECPDEEETPAAGGPEADSRPS